MAIASGTNFRQNLYSEAVPEEVKYPMMSFVHAIPACLPTNYASTWSGEVSHRGELTELFWRARVEKSYTGIDCRESDGDDT